MDPALLDTPRDSVRTLYRDNQDMLAPAQPAADMDIKSLSAKDYIQQITVAFQDFKDIAIEHDFILKKLPPGYLVTCNTDFKPTGMRVMMHNWANLMQGMELLRPTIDFFDNKTEVLEEDGALRKAAVTIELLAAFQQFGQSFHTYHDQARKRKMGKKVLANFERFGERMRELTEQFAADKEDLSVLPNLLQKPGNENTPFIQKANHHRLNLN